MFDIEIEKNIQGIQNFVTIILILSLLNVDPIVDFIILSRMNLFGLWCLSIYPIFLAVILEKTRTFIFPNIFLFFLSNFYHSDLFYLREIYHKKSLIDAVLFSITLSLFYLSMGLIWCVARSLIYIKENRQYFATIKKREDKYGRIDKFVTEKKNMIILWIVYWPLSIINIIHSIIVSILDIAADKIYFCYLLLRNEIHRTFIVLFLYLIDSEIS